MTGSALRVRMVRAGAAAILVAGILGCCAACAPSAGSAASASGAAGSPAVSAPTGSSASAAARAERIRVDAALGHRVVWLEYLCSVTSERDPGLVFVALHERTTWQTSGRTSSLDAVIGQPVRADGSRTWVAAGAPVTIRSTRDHRLAADAFVGLVGPDHRCSARYIGPPVTG